MVQVAKVPSASIESGIPIPPKKAAEITSYGRKINLSDTLDSLSDGDSFVVDQSPMRDYALILGARKAIKLTSRKQDGRYRIWRKE